LKSTAKAAGRKEKKRCQAKGCPTEGWGNQIGKGVTGKRPMGEKLLKGKEPVFHKGGHSSGNGGLLRAVKTLQGERRRRKGGGCGPQGKADQTRERWSVVTHQWKGGSKKKRGIDPHKKKEKDHRPGSTPGGCYVGKRTNCFFAGSKRGTGPWEEERNSEKKGMKRIPEKCGGD